LQQETVKVQVLDSTETLFSFVTKDPETAETLAAIAGTEIQMMVTEQTSENVLFKSKTGMGTQREVHEYLVHPNEFKMLNTGEAIYIAKKPNRYGTVKVNYIEIPMAQSLLKLDLDVGKIRESTKLLDLSSIRSVQKTEYVSSFAKPKENNFGLEI